MKIRYDGQNRKPFCSHCKILGHYYKDCEEYAKAIQESHARIEQAELEELVEARISKEEQERQEEEKIMERERILREIADDRNQRIADRAWDKWIQNKAKERMAQENMDTQQTTDK